MFMKTIYYVLGLCLLLSSCTTLKFATDQKSISTLAIDYEVAEKVNPIYKTIIDASFEKAMQRFNQETRSFKVHRRVGNEAAGLNFDLSKGKFVSKGGVTAGYVVSGLGLIAAPIGTLAATGGEWLVLFYYFPADRVNFSAALSDDLAEKVGKKKKFIIEVGALFTSKTKRTAKMSFKLDQTLYNILVKLDKQKSK